MATDWAADVKKYAPNADDGVIAGIVRYCGIALRKVDSSLVAFSDKKETDRVRENFLKKKLGLTQADKTLDAAIAKVGEAMKADRTKNRVTVYYLLAENFKKLDLFAPKAKVAVAKKPAAKAAGTAALAGAAGLAAASAAKAPAKAAAKPKAAPAKKAAVVATTKKPATKKVAIKAAAAPQRLMDKAGAGTAAVVGAAGIVAAGAANAATNVADAAKDAAAKTVDLAGTAVAGAAGLAASAAGTAGSAVSGAAASLTGTDDEDSGLGWLLWLLFAALVAFVLWWVFMRGSPDEAAAPAAATTEAAALAAPAADAPAAAAPADLAAAPAEGSVAIPDGAGVTSELRDGKPVVKVYFDTGRTEIVPAFAGAAGGLKTWLDANPGSSLEVSGFNDPTGNAAANARLSKRRAEAVGASLVASGIAQTAVALVKPEAATDSTTDPAGARRVEVTVK